MNQTIPFNSNIEVTTCKKERCIIIPHKSGGVVRYLIGAFLLFWLGGWVVGLITVSKEIISGRGNAFMMFWLGGWIIGGIFAIYFAYRILRKSIPEKLILNKPNLTIDTGIAPFKIDFNMIDPRIYWKLIFQKREIIEFNTNEIKSLKLRETDTGNRLTIDTGTKRVDIATSATEIEREWLFKYLSQNYSL